MFIALINTILSLYYYLKIVKAMYINKSDEPIAAFRSDNYTRACGKKADRIDENEKNTTQKDPDSDAYNHFEFIYK